MLETAAISRKPLLSPHLELLDDRLISYDPGNGAPPAHLHFAQSGLPHGLRVSLIGSGTGAAGEGGGGRGRGEGASGHQGRRGMEHDACDLRLVSDTVPTCMPTKTDSSSRSLASTAAGAALASACASASWALSCSTRSTARRPLSVARRSATARRPSRLEIRLSRPCGKAGTYRIGGHKAVKGFAFGQMGRGHAWVLAAPTLHTESLDAVQMPGSCPLYRFSGGKRTRRAVHSGTLT